MKQQILYLLPLLLASASARPSVNRPVKREVPQEQSHKNILDVVNQALQLNNPDEIVDAVFGLLGAAAAADGAGNIADADCLQQATADQAFTNGKEAGDVDLMTAALIYRALERNTGSVGLESVACESIQAVNVEIAALQQHQDPAADGAQDLNQQIAFELARQIASIGGDPLQALEASTFAPGEIGDPTAKGNTCDDENDDLGCINSQNLRVDDASVDEILAAVEDGAGAGIAAGNATEAAGAACNVKRVKRRHAAPKPQKKRQAGGAADFGTCNNLDIVFGPPSDGRQEDAFEAADLTNFPHGSALNIKVISDFICSSLTNKCDADEAAVAICEDASAQASALKAQAAADAFNQAIAA